MPSVGELWQRGEAYALRRLKSWCDRRLLDYETKGTRESNGLRPEVDPRDALVTVGNGDTYEDHWHPVTVAEAMRDIVLSDDETFFEESGKAIADEILKLLNSSDDVVLDLGCGIGRIAKHIAPHCSALWLVDISSRMLTIARERLATYDNLHFVQSLAGSVPEVPENAIDLLYSVLVLQHVEREDAFCMLRDIRRMLRPSGVAYLTFPNLLGDEYLASFVHYANTGEVANKARARFYTPAEVDRLLRAAGFERIDLVAADDILAICR